MLPSVSDVFDGRYRIDETLGTGGFADVFGAMDLREHRDVALKILRPDRRDGTYAPDTVARFHREAALLAPLTDPHTVRLLAHGVDPHGLLFLVFERLRGEDLATRLGREGRLDWATTQQVLLQVLGALAEAHAQGLVHRDIKPENIFLVEGPTPDARLLDFGIARPLAPTAPQITSSGALVGTVRYMPPEQLSGQPVGPPADIYSLGMVGIEMMLGREALRQAQWHDRLQANFAFDLGDVVTHGSPAQVLRKMTAHDVADRYPSARAARRAVETASAKGALEAPHVPARPAPGPRLWIAGAGLLVLAGIYATVAASIDRPAPPPAPPKPAAGQVPQPAAAAARIAFGQADETHAGPSETARSGCGAAAPRPGRSEERANHHLNMLRWLRYVPSSYDSDRPAALVILLHQTDEGPDVLLPLSGFEPLADEHGFVVVAPFARDRRPWSEPATDVDALMHVVKETSRTLCIDRTRVFVVGHGAGGEFAHRLACEPWVTAIATNSYRAGPTDAFCAREPAKPHIMFSPLHSPREPMEGGLACGGKEVFSTAQVEGQWRKRNGCDDAPQRASQYDGGTCYAWECEAPFASCHLDGGHPWPGVPPRFVWQEACDGTAPDFPIAAHAWEFFRNVRPLSHPLVPR